MKPSSSRNGRLKPVLIVVIVAAVVATAVYAYASPYIALRHLKEAINARDSQTIDGYVDFPALRTSLKQELTDELMRRVDARNRNNPFAIIGALIGSAMIGPIVDAYATPDGVAALLNGMPPRGVPGEHPPEMEDNRQQAGAASGSAGVAPPAAKAPPPARTDENENPHAYVQSGAGYRGFDSFVVTYQPQDGGTRYAAIFRRSGLFGWKLSAVDLHG